MEKFRPHDLSAQADVQTDRLTDRNGFCSPVVPDDYFGGQTLRYNWFTGIMHYSNKPVIF